MGDYRQVGWLVHWYEEGGTENVLWSLTPHRANSEWSEPMFIDASRSEAWQRQDDHGPE